MIAGVGIDSISIERVKKACQQEAFMARCFTDRERELFWSGGCIHYERCAGNFAVKEAVSKVFGTGFRTMELRDIEVLRDELGKPYVILLNGALQLMKEQEIKRIFVSITNTELEATAFAVGEK